MHLPAAFCLYAPARGFLPVRTCLQFYLYVLARGYSPVRTLPAAFLPVRICLRLLACKYSSADIVFNFNKFMTYKNAFTGREPAYISRFSAGAGVFLYSWIVQDPEFPIIRYAEVLERIEAGCLRQKLS